MRSRFEQDDPGQGIFFVAATGTETRVEKVLAHTGARVVFLVPDGLLDGDCTLEVRMLLHGNRAVWKGALPGRMAV